MEWGASLWCGLDGIRIHYEEHYAIWTIVGWALIVFITGVLLISLWFYFRKLTRKIKNHEIGEEEAEGHAWKIVRRRGFINNAVLFLVCSLVLAGTAYWLWGPRPSTCLQTSQQILVVKSLAPAAHQIEIGVPPIFGTAIQNTERERVYTDKHNGWLRVWLGRNATDDSYREILANYLRDRDRARRDLLASARIETDRSPTEEAPYFVLSWQSRDFTDNYVCERIRSTDGKAYIDRFEILAPIHNNVLIVENYEAVLKNCTGSVAMTPSTP